MKFTVRTTGAFYTPDEAAKLEKLGFQFSDRGETFWENEPKTRYNNCNHVEVEINTLEELLAFADEWGEVIISDDNTLEIYDDYRE